MKPQIASINRAIQIIARLPEGTEWGLFVTNEDIGGDDGTLSSLNISVSSTEELGEVFRAIDPHSTVNDVWELSKFGDYIRRFDLLEVTVELVPTGSHEPI